VTVPFNDLSRAVAADPAGHRAALERVLESGWYVLGEEGRAFEREFGDRVLGGVDVAGATPVLCDVEPQAATMDPDSLARTLTPRTRAVVPVHLYGQCADVEAIRAVAGAIPIVEDCAQAHGAALRGRPAGTMGDLAAFSFYPTKNLGGLGDGGAVAGADTALVERVRLLRQYGQTGRYEHVAQGVNSRLDELQAAFLRVKLDRLTAWNARRARIAAHYRAELADHAGVRLPAVRPEAEPSWHLFAVRCAERDALAEHLRARGVETLVHYPTPPHQTGAYAQPARHPNAEAWAREELSLPIGPHLSDAQVELVVAAVTGFGAAGR
jgi:dTDP-3-amino-3,4,6-trideoxy-alpha-D-glucose transaminase